MDAHDVDALFERIEKMGDADRKALDPICYALEAYRKRHKDGARPVPNRIVALACVDLLRKWEEVTMSEPNL